METNRYPDLLKKAIARNRKDLLSPDFTARTLLRLQTENARKEHRTYAWGIVAATFLSLGVIAMASFIMYRYNMLPSFENLTSIRYNLRSYLIESIPYFGLSFLLTLLLAADFLFRRRWYKRHGFGNE